MKREMPLRVRIALYLFTAVLVIGVTIINFKK